MRGKTIFHFSIIIGSALLAASCGGGGSSSPPQISIQLGASSLTVLQDGTTASLTVSITSSGGNPSQATLSLTGLPAGVMSRIVSSGSGGNINFTAQGAAAGTYPVTVNALNSSASSSANFTLVVAILATVENTVNTNVGVNGRLQEFMATSFQPAEWDSSFFANFPNVTPLTTLGPQHIRIQGISQAVPMKANSTPQLPGDWDFTILDDVVQPILKAADHNPEFQVAVAPSFMNNSNGQIDIANDLNDFVQYSANLVRYYNTGGFDWGGQHFQSPTTGTYKITWWGIFNEYNINGLTPAQYVQLYNAVVPAMLAVDPTIQISALELADFDSGTGDPRANLPTFVAPANQGGVSAPVGILSTHFYSSCNQTDTDTTLFSTVAGFKNDVSYFYQELKLRPDLANVTVWVTENNVNADFSNAQGNSTCNPMQKFVTDTRGTSAFFAAWRPFVFSQLGQAGNQALYHWDYDADQQYGEVDYTTGKTYLSYWVDYYLARYFPSPPGSNILNLNATETSTVEILATKNDDGSVVVMVADRAVHSSTDNNGTGDPRTVIVDVSALGAFASATQLTIDSTTDPAAGPVAAAVTPASRLTVTLGGYGVTFLLLK
jgi:hypothetical protein